MFPQVASKFLAQRAEGPKSVGKTPTADVAAGKPVPAPKQVDGQGPLTTPITYEIKIGDKSHKVSVQPA